MDNNKKHTIELSHIFQQYGQGYMEQHRLSTAQRKALRDICLCRTESLGGHVEKCDQCGYTRYAYNSCRNRHCPKCQFIKQWQWVDKIKSKLPPIRYFHLVFTIPQQLHNLFYLNQAIAYKLLFAASARALMQCADNPKFLGAKTGALSVLHTWGTALNYHPHIHMIAPAGGLSEDGMEWIHANAKFFLPVKVLSKLFRGILCKLIEQEIKAGNISLSSHSKSFSSLKNQLYKKNWNVYAKKPMAGPERVIEYLGKYTHRVAISNHRIIQDNKGRITFKCKDSKTGLFNKILTLDAGEFIKRFMRHVLPSGFYKIRYFGIMALCKISQQLEICFDFAGKNACLPILEGLSAIEALRELTGKDPWKCPACKTGKLKICSAIDRPIEPG